MSMTVDGLFTANAAEAPEHLALIDAPNRAVIADGPARRLTYRELEREVAALAHRLTAAGLSPGDVLLVQMPNVAELIMLYLAAARIGVVMSPVPVQYRHGELGPIVAALRPRAFCTVTRCGKADLLAEFRNHVRFDGALLAFGSHVPDGAVDLGRDGGISTTGLPPPPDGEALFSICWTSGTEGQPKAVPKTQANWLNSAANATNAGWLPRGRALLMPFPAVNAAAIGGLLMSWLGNAGTLVLHHPFDLDVFLSQIAEERVAYTLMAPALLVSVADRLEARPGALDLTSLVAVATGSASVEPAVLARFEGLIGAQVINIFGSNEGLQLVSDRAGIPEPERRARSFPRVGDQTWRPGSSTANGARFRLLTPGTEQECTTPGEPAEMVIAGPPVFPGYMTPDGLDRRRFTSDGWFRTSDLFEIDADDPSVMRFVGRAREIIVRGGMKIAPAELDAALARHPAVREAAVAPYPDERLGERVAAFVVARPGPVPTLDDLCAALGDQGIARYKWPERLILIDALPRNPLGKIQRKELAARAAAEDDRS